jgi:hypothetical protein
MPGVGASRVGSSMLFLELQDPKKFLEFRAKNLALLSQSLLNPRSKIQSSNLDQSPDTVTKRVPVFPRQPCRTLGRTGTSKSPTQ